MIKQVNALFSFLPLSKRIIVIFFTSILTISGLIEVTGFISIVPFAYLVMSPSTLTSNPFFASLYHHFGSPSLLRFETYIGLGIIMLLIVGNSIKVISVVFFESYVGKLILYLQQNLYNYYLYQPFLYHLKNSSINLTYSIENQMRVICLAYIQLARIIANSICVVVIGLILLKVLFMITIISFVVILGCYAVIFLFFKQKLQKMTRNFDKRQGRFVQIMQESLRGIKEIKLLGKEKYYEQLFDQASQGTTEALMVTRALGEAPRYIVETIVFGGLVTLTLFFLHKYHNPTKVVTSLSLMAISGYRLIPLIQMVYSSAILFKFSGITINNNKTLIQLALRFNRKKIKLEQDNKFYLVTNDRIDLTNKLTLENVSFHYPSSGKKIYDEFNLVIPAKKTIAFTGPSGAGKTTLVDIIIGLLDYQSGTIRVDGQLINKENKRCWQNSIGYVPQMIYLYNDTIKNNISLGIAHEKVSMEQIIKAAKLANIHDFVMSLPKQYESLVGENGILVSGGQRQRIGIARALYHQASTLVFDEATSALDGMTESLIMQSVDTLNHEKTIIIIAHRLSTVKKCDLVYFFNNGKIIDSGTYDELIEKNALFRAMAEQTTDTL